MSRAQGPLFRARRTRRIRLPRRRTSHDCAAAGTPDSGGQRGGEGVPEDEGDV